MAPKKILIEDEINWLANVLATRLQLYFNQPSGYNTIDDIPAPAMADFDDDYANFIRDQKLNRESRLLLIIALIPLLKPQLFDSLMIRNTDTEQRFTEFGGIKAPLSNTFISTLATYAFIIAGDAVDKKIECIFHSIPHNQLMKKKWIVMETPAGNEPYTATIIQPSQELIDKIFHGADEEQHFSTSFPAKKITTRQSWTDLVLEENVMKQIDDISTWVDYGEALHATLGLEDRLNPGHRCLFYGASGTGKTLTATLLGKKTGLDVYRIDLSLIVSKYIGETEKNLSRIFDLAENKNWILFFDEADALFGKRTQVKDAHDRFANQEVSYLLQRVEEYNGLVILATNFKSNIDEAFARRFQTVIHFPIPKAEQRLALWRKILGGKMRPAAGIDLELLAGQYELSGGSIINIIRYCSLMALKRNSNLISLTDLQEGIKREYLKQGKAM